MLKKQKWDADAYHTNSSVQHTAALKLLEQISLNGNENILDIGCGDGKITSFIASTIPSGSIIGIDSSPNMIKFAQSKYQCKESTNISFLVENASKIAYNNAFDIIFSSFAIQWILDKNDLFSRIFRALKSKGVLIATIPLGISLALQKAVDEMMCSRLWSEHFVQFKKNWEFIPTQQFLHLLKKNRFKVKLINEVDQQVFFESRSKFEQYVLPWFRYLDYIPSKMQSDFFKQTIDLYLQYQPPLPPGIVKFDFPRVDIVAEKIT